MLISLRLSRSSVAGRQLLTLSESRAHRLPSLSWLLATVIALAALVMRFQMAAGETGGGDIHGSNNPQRLMVSKGQVSKVTPTTDCIKEILSQTKTGYIPDAGPRDILHKVMMLQLEEPTTGEMTHTGGFTGHLADKEVNSDNRSLMDTARIDMAYVKEKQEQRILKRDNHKIESEQKDEHKGLALKGVSNNDNPFPKERPISGKLRVEDWIEDNLQELRRGLLKFGGNPNREKHNEGPTTKRRFQKKRDGWLPCYFNAVACYGR